MHTDDIGYMYVRERNQNGDCGTGPRLLAQLFCQSLFMTQASCFISPGHNKVLQIFYFLCMKQLEDKQWEKVYGTKVIKSASLDKEELGV